MPGPRLVVLFGEVVGRWGMGPSWRTQATRDVLLRVRGELGENVENNIMPFQCRISCLGLDIKESPNALSKGEET